MNMVVKPKEKIALMCCLVDERLEKVESKCILFYLTVTALSP